MPGAAYLVHYMLHVDFVVKQVLLWLLLHAVRGNVVSLLMWRCFAPQKQLYISIINNRIEESVRALVVLDVDGQENKQHTFTHHICYGMLVRAAPTAV